MITDSASLDRPPLHLMLLCVLVILSYHMAR